MKRIILLFVGAAASFLLFSYMDEYENLVMPFFVKARRVMPSGAPKEATESARRAIIAFNNSLSKAYLSSDPSLLMEARMDERLRSSVAEEIHYLAREGKIMSIRVEEIEVYMIKPVSPSVMQVETRETVYLRYLAISDRREEATFAPAMHRMRYMLQTVDGGWKVLSFEAITAEEKNPL